MRISDWSSDVCSSDLFQVLVIQATASIAAYGYFFRDLAGWERWAFVIATAVGFGAVIDNRFFWNWALVVLIVALTAWITVSSRLRPAAVDRKSTRLNSSH